MKVQQTVTLKVWSQSYAPEWKSVEYRPKERMLNGWKNHSQIMCHSQIMLTLSLKNQKLKSFWGHIPTFLPKFHPELNPIVNEWVWAQLKRYTRSHCNYSIRSLRFNIQATIDSISLENVQNHFRKVKHFMFCYLEGLVPETDLDERLKKYKKAVESHRRIGENE